jgi:hypothetical protein
MPTFPTYRGELPQCLNPLNLRHYFLLAYWVYFRPTALKCYLYRADPDLYRAGRWLGIFRALRAPAYRNLYLMAPGVIVLLSVLVGLPLVLAVSWVQSTPVDWLGWAGVVVLGLVFGLVIGLLAGLVFGLAVGVAAGLAFGVVLAVGASVVVGTVEDVVSDVTSSLVVGMAFGVAFGAASHVAFGAVYGLVFGMMYGVIIGIGEGVAEGVATGVGISVGALHVLFYPLQFGLALRSIFRRGGHPLDWDELVVLPLPGTRRVLARRLWRGEPDGLRFLADVARNPFQRWTAQQTLQVHLHNEAASLYFL